MTGERPRRIEICNPGAMHFTYALGAAVQRLGYAGRYHTSLYYKTAAWRSWLALLPPGLRRRAERQLRRRLHAGLDADRVVSHNVIEGLRLAAGRAGFAGSALMRWRNRTADRRMAQLVRRRPPAAVIGHDTAALLTLMAAREVGSLGILNQVIGHRALGEPLLLADLARWPAFAEERQLKPDPAMTDYCRQEALAAGHCLAPSDYVRQTLEAVGVAAERISVLPYGVDVERFRPRSGERMPGPVRLLFVGQLSQRKGLAYLLEALAGLPQGLVEATLVGPLSAPPAALAPYADRFRHLPAVPYQEVHRVFADADVFVYPSLHEGSALAIYEALAAGLPVVTTPNSGSVVEEGRQGFLVPAGSVAPLRERIGELAEDVALRRRMAEAARARALEFTWTRYEQSLRHTLEELIGPPAN
ncbi:MAG TPA: glycosyltransferase family 4 protein [Kiloniellales bacterium]|nr:glycosyltransferase family 4 protein [Kiloniellales bacterium]